MAAFVWLLLTALMFHPSGSAAVAQEVTSAEPPILRTILVLGLAPDDEAQLRGLVPIEIGEPLTQQAVAELDENLRGSGLPLDAMKLSVRRASDAPAASELPDDPFAEEVTLVFDFRPAPKFTRLTLFPLLPVNLQRLRAAFTLKPGDPADPRALAGALAALRDELTSQGYGTALLTPQQLLPTSGTLELQLMIEARDPVVLERFSFKGAGWPLWGPGGKLRPYLKKLKPVPFDRGSTVTAQMLRRVEHEAGLVMRAQGFLQATARLEETTVTAKGLRTRYRIERGPRFRVGERSVSGMRLPDPAFWQPATEPYANKYFTIDRLRDLEKALERQAMTKGYMAAQVKLAYVPELDQHRVAINGAVDEGTTSRLGLVRFQREAPELGYGKSSYHRSFAPPMTDAVIRRQIRAIEGQPLDLDVIDDAQDRLERLGIFEKVEVVTTSTADLYVRDLVAKIKEQRTGVLASSVGWADAAGPVGRVTYSESNLWGLGDRLVASLGGRTDGIGGDVSYLDRNWALGDRQLGREREPYLLWNAALDGQTFDEYAEQRLGGGVQFGYLLGGGRGRWSNSWEARVEQFSYSAFGSPDRYAEDFNGYLATTLAYRLTYEALTIRNKRPYKGYQLSSELEAGAADGMLLRWTNRAEWHRPLSKHFGWDTRGLLGLMPMDADSVGISHRYQLGGLESLRGFDYRGVGPVDALNPALQTGGATMLSVQNELRVIVNDDLEFPLFFDVGTLGQGPLQIGAPRASVGLGIRLTIPGLNQPAYAYLAHAVLKEETDDTQMFHFGFNVEF